MVRKFCLLSLLGLLIVVASACQPVRPVPAPRSAAAIAEQLMGIRQSVVVDGVGPSKAKDPAAGAGRK